MKDRYNAGERESDKILLKRTLRSLTFLSTIEKHTLQVCMRIRAGARMSGGRPDRLSVRGGRTKRPIGAMTAPRLGSDGNTIGKASASAADCLMFCVGHDRPL